MRVIGVKSVVSVVAVHPLAPPCADKIRRPDSEDVGNSDAYKEDDQRQGYLHKDLTRYIRKFVFNCEHLFRLFLEGPMKLATASPSGGGQGGEGCGDGE